MLLKGKKYHLLKGASFSSTIVSPQMIYVDSDSSRLVKGINKKNFQRND